jgi:hypothetical protein
VEEGAARGRSVSRLNVLIATTAAIIGLIYGYDLGSIASALLFLALALVSFAFIYARAPETRGRPLEVIRTYWYNGGRWPEKTST